MKKVFLIVLLSLFFNFYAELTSTISEKRPDILWSILICTLEARKDQFNQLFTKLENQIKQAGLQGEIEIMYFKDNRENSIGYKRNKLIDEAQGKYVCFIDDDDNVHEHYIEMIYKKLLQEPDCVSLHGIITFDGKSPRHFIHSIKYDHYFEKDGIYYRPPNHLNPIKKEIAKQFLFPETNWQEDTNWAMQIAQSGLLQKEAKTEIPYYFYHYTDHKKPLTAYTGQVGQDKFANEMFFKNKKNGVFVDIGAFDGVTHSNTYFFEKELGWKGLCIEPLAQSFSQCASLRNCICLNHCIATTNAPVDFIAVEGAPIMLSGIMQTYDPRHLQRLKHEIIRDGGSYTIKKISAQTFNDICQKHNIFEIDFLSLDTEGSELEILKSINFNTFFIHVITVENNYHEPFIRKLLESKEFKFIAMLGWQDEIYINKKSYYLN